MNKKTVSKKEREFSPVFSVSESMESNGKYIQATSACEGPYAVSACTDPVFTTHAC